MPTISFSGDIKNVIRGLDSFERDLFSDNTVKEFDTTLKQMREVVITTFDKTSTRNPIASKPNAFSGVSSKIKENITFEGGVKGHSPFTVLEGGIGKTKLLDKEDPIFDINRTGNPQRHPNKFRLWRMLDTGTSTHIIMKRLAPILVFFSRRLNVWVKRRIVTHPGMKGRHYFEASDYKCQKIFFGRLIKYLDTVVARH